MNCIRDSFKDISDMEVFALHSENSRRLWLFLGSARRFPRKFLENRGKIDLSQIVKCFEFWDFGHQERQTCLEHWVDTVRDLVPTFCAECLF